MFDLLKFQRSDRGLEGLRRGRKCIGVKWQEGISEQGLGGYKEGLKFLSLLFVLILP